MPSARLHWLQGSYMLPQHGAVPAWWGFLNAAEKDRIESVINKAQRYGYLPSSFENVHSLVNNMESKLFNRILSNPRRVLYQLLPPEKDTGYNLRQRSHHLTLPFTDNNVIRKNFLHRMLFMDIYWCTRMYVCFDVLHSLHVDCRLIY